MALTKLVPILYTNVIQESVNFYQTKLGFTCVVLDKELEWATLERDKVTIMLSKPHRHLNFEKSIFTGSFYINTDDVDCLWEQLKDKANICYPVENFEYGMREFAIYDNNGYVVQFGQKLEE